MELKPDAGGAAKAESVLSIDIKGEGASVGVIMLDHDDSRELPFAALNTLLTLEVVLVGGSDELYEGLLNDCDHCVAGGVAKGVGMAAMLLPTGIFMGMGVDMKTGGHFVSILYSNIFVASRQALFVDILWENERASLSEPNPRKLGFVGAFAT